MPEHGAEMFRGALYEQTLCPGESEGKYQKGLTSCVVFVRPREQRITRHDSTR
jgi:hypothetical protein